MTLEGVLGTELPIIQAPMAGSQGAELAIAVSEAGGLGSLPCAMLDAEALRRELTRIASETDKPYNVNFFCHTMPRPDAARDASWRAALRPYYEELGIDPTSRVSRPARLPFDVAAADVLAEFRPPVVSFHFGLPSPDLLLRVKGLGSTVISSATTVAEALWLEEHGVDVIVAQGLEAGGHRGMFLSDDLSTQLNLAALLRGMIDAVGVPVVAAGGIVNASGVASVMALGAAGAQVGTAYLLCPEASTSAAHRAALQSDGARTTALTNLFSGRPARGIVNRLMREIGPLSDLAPEFPLAAQAITPLRALAESQGSGDFSPLWAGDNAAGCREVSAAHLTRELGVGAR